METMTGIRNILRISQSFSRKSWYG